MCSDGIFYIAVQIWPPNSGKKDCELIFFWILWAAFSLEETENNFFTTILAPDGWIGWVEQPRQSFVGYKSTFSVWLFETVQAVQCQTLTDFQQLYRTGQNCTVENITIENQTVESTKLYNRQFYSRETHKKKLYKRDLYNIQLQSWVE